MAIPFRLREEFLRGLVERYDSHARILIRAGQRSAVKELCHIAIDQREDWSRTVMRRSKEDQLNKENGETETPARKLAAVTVQSERLAISRPPN
jgi:hypothetical protein